MHYRQACIRFSVAFWGCSSETNHKARLADCRNGTGIKTKRHCAFL